ncbi:MAG: 1,6-anhydro-N-acetylmuramyl-L-alanine amidase AmpD [Gammaproteobacteria bacterium]|nr:MAG: 1,6-anhydro-N-acetylmuramyl-L-alanine amidase AmpD [Gammaproteobacteria bacterium]RKZ95647.1 MAG: 1,6-anhydro-N-acetylmuramyl-L-alanine amidase AmpD [Gammaproteobacteria bacterium]RKZ98089.1 MAG: 1,6-anhydro-N-acetylmuramyl-L-alanine amidase AmpD [Gammaproteobacteria bacterium]
MQVDRQLGLISGAEYYDSPNQDERPDVEDISGIVIHNISLPPGEFGGGWIDDLFLNKLDSHAHPYFEKIADLKVSAHILIRRNGDIIQYVPFHQRAWHAGMSCWDDRECCNDFTIGIELEGCDEQTFEDIQYTNLVLTVQALIKAYPKLSVDRITGHSDIASGRKTDPGPYFDWSSFKAALA